MKMLFKILLFVVMIAILAFLILWCVSSLKGMSFVEYMQSLFATSEPAVAIASNAFKIYTGGITNV